MKNSALSAKLLAFIMIICTFFSASMPVYAKIGDVVGTAYNTDIVAYINHYAVPSYAAYGSSFIVAEDLKNFGFNVDWDPNTRSLNIYRNKNKDASEMTVTKFEKAGSYFSDILETDISVYANGVKLSSYAINGYTLIPLEELTMFGFVSYINDERALKLWIDGLSIRSEKQLPETSKISAPVSSVLIKGGGGFGFCVNSVDGVKVLWQAKNNTGKYINYYTAYFSMYNPVWDPAPCQIKQTNRINTKTVGPVPPGENLIVFNIIGYSSVCRYVVLDKLYLEYSDGTTEWIDYGYIGEETLWDKYYNNWL